MGPGSAKLARTATREWSAKRHHFHQRTLVPASPSSHRSLLAPLEGSCRRRLEAIRALEVLRAEPAVIHRAPRFRIRMFTGVLDRKQLRLDDLATRIVFAEATFRVFRFLQCLTHPPSLPCGVVAERAA